MKINLFEFEDLNWFPDIFRKSMTDYLRYFLNAINFYQPVTPILKECMDKSNNTQIIDLCSGSGGPIQKIQENFESAFTQTIPITLTDKFPNLSAFQYLRLKSNSKINYVEFSVDAMHVPKNLVGLRTIFSGFHHFNREQAKAVIQNAVDSKQAIAIFDGGDKNLLTIIGIIIFHPIAFFLFTPFFRPFRISRIIFTYLIPIIPLCTIWDGVVSITRLYTPIELFKLAKEIQSENYKWKSGKVKNKFKMNITYLVGYPLCR